MVAVRALGKVGDRRAVEPLIALLDDRHAQVAATIALGRIGDERAIPALLDGLGDRDEFAARIVMDFPGWLQFARHPIGTIEAFFGGPRAEPPRTRPVKSRLASLSGGRAADREAARPRRCVDTNMGGQARGSRRRSRSAYTLASGRATYFVATAAAHPEGAPPARTSRPRISSADALAPQERRRVDLSAPRGDPRRRRRRAARP
ncbi:MAG: HEAT repeat domain-containing protein [Actinomycetota bacterium]|nr:HEAT repeat domain-containing protein [Actinomycetota bacterium]